MRIAVVNWTRLHTGGVETYLTKLIPELLGHGHAVGFWHEMVYAGTWERIALPEGVPTWCADELGFERAVAALSAWRPDLIYAHVMTRLETEARMLELAPAVFFGHGHTGTCISGFKTHKFPAPTPCTKHFGWPCLLHYYPRRCGGLNPLTMWRDYRHQSQRLANLQRYAAIVLASEYLKNEYVKHGLKEERIHLVPMPVATPGCDSAENTQYEVRSTEYEVRSSEHSVPRTPGVSMPVLGPRSSVLSPQSSVLSPRNAVTTELMGPRRLLYVGRMDRLKGGGVLLKALPHVLQALRRPIQVTLAGDGPERARWEQEAASLCGRHPNLSISFLGWQSPAQVAELYPRSDLLVLPSVLPETFGLVGPEAGLSGVPAAAFRVGGVTSWLFDGCNGHLAPSDPPTAAGLAEAIVQCLADPAHHARLRRGALEAAQRFSLQAHVEALLPILAAACETQTERT